MNLDDFRAALKMTLEDLKLSRGERRALDTMLRGIDISDHDRNVLRAEVFALARESAANTANAVELIEWLDHVLKPLEPREEAAKPRRSDACFSPGHDCVNRITGLIRGARNTIDICVFTITDNRISEEIHEAHRRGVRVRILSDNQKALDLGSDIAQLATAGVAVRIDDSPYHMHHKFAIFDGDTLLTGSYNWTLGAARDNQENLVVTDDSALLAEFQRVFDELWGRFSDFGVRE